MIMQNQTRKTFSIPAALTQAALSIPALLVAGLQLLAPAAQAGDRYWSGNGSTLGGGGAWDTSSSRWGASAAGPFSSTWNNGNNDAAIFAGTAGAVTNGMGITVGGLQFNTTAYVINNTPGNTLSFGTGTNAIRLNNNIAAATITGPVGGSASVTFRTTPYWNVAGTLTFDGPSSGGWSGTTTIYPSLTLRTLTTSGNINQVLDSTSGITLNGGTIQFTRATNADLNAINNAAVISVNGGGTISVTSSSGGASAIEDIGTVTVNSGVMNFVQTANNQNTLRLASLSRGSSADAGVAFSSPAFTIATFVVNGASATPAGEIIGPWATVGTAANSQTDYAIYNGSAQVVAAGASLPITGEGGWTSGSSAYQFATAQTLTADRTAAALRYTAGSNTVDLAGFTLKTGGILNGGSGLLTIAGTGTLTAPGTSGGKLYLNNGKHAITVSAKIADNGGPVTVVKTGSPDFTGGAATVILSSNNEFTGGLVVNSTGGNFAVVRLVGAQSFTGGITLNAGNLGDSTGVSNAALNNNSITVNGAATFMVASGETLSANSTITINSTGALNIGPAGGTMTVNGVVSGSGVLDVSANNRNSDNIVVLANTNNTFTGDVINTCAHGGTRWNELRVNSIGDAGKVVNGLASSGNGNIQIFTLNSTATSDLTFNTRQFELAGINKFDSTLRIGNNSARAFTINTDLLVSGTGPRTLQLQGTGAGTNTFAGKIVDGPGMVVSLTKAEAGTWVLSGDNTYSGPTTVNAGTLVLAGSQTLSDTAALTIASSGTRKVHLNTGVKEKVGSLVFGTDPQVTGTWGSSASTAENKNDTYFSGEGLLYVGIDTPPSGTVIIVK
jgi:fibronectin-binding autotransporter adhesin